MMLGLGLKTKFLVVALVSKTLALALTSNAFAAIPCGLFNAYRV